jgi:hypothetical protein
VRRPRNTDTRGSGIALLELAHPPQHTAQHHNSTRLRAAWYFSRIANEQSAIYDFAYQAHRMGFVAPTVGLNKSALWG